MPIPQTSQRRGRAMAPAKAPARVEVTHGRFPLEANAKHANFHWGVTLPVLKNLIERGQGPGKETEWKS